MAITDYNKRRVPTATGGTFAPNTQTSDINRMWRDNRTDAFDEGNAIDYDLRQQQDYRGGLEDVYRGGMDTAYNDLEQTPGYTDAETTAIMREPQFTNLQATDQDFAQLGPTDTETAGMRGDPSSYDDYFDQDLQRQIDTNAANQQRGAVQTATERIGGALGTQQEAFNEAIDPSQLGVSEDYYANTGGALRDSTGQIRESVDPTKLRYDQQVADESRFTDQDVNDWQAKAGNTIRNRYAAAKDAVTQGAAAQGNADALAIASARGRMENQEAVGAADATTNARIQGRMAQTGRNMELEDARLAAERGYSGLRSSNEQTIADRTLGQANKNESLRLDANRDISNRRIDTAGKQGSDALGAYKFTGDLATGVEGNIGAREAGTQQNITDRGTDINIAKEQTAAGREADLYANRAGIKKYGIDTKYGQGMGVNTQLSNTAGGVANARRQGQSERRGWLTDQTGQQVEAGQTATGQRIQNYGTRAGAVNSATGGLSSWEVANQGNTALSKAGRAGKVVGDWAMRAAGK